MTVVRVPPFAHLPSASWRWVSASLVALLLTSVPVSAQPAITPDAPVMRLDELGLYQVGYAYRGQKERLLPLGWTGDFTEQAGVACRPAGEQNGRQAFLLHCPWRNGTGVTFQDFTFRVPRVRRVLLRGATALLSSSARQSDGVTYRVYANGRRLMEVNRRDDRWLPFRFDLTPYAGKTLTLRFETDPSPSDDPSFDFSLWADRELVLEGYRPRRTTAPAPPPLDLTRVWPARNGSVVPLSGFAGQRTVRLEGDTALFRYRGTDGTLEYRWRRPAAPGAPLFGDLRLTARARGGRSVTVPLATDASAAWTGPARALGSRWERGRQSVTCVRSFQVGGQPAALRITGRLVGKSLVLDVACDRPVVARLEAGGWGPTLRRRPVTVPYYSGQVYYLPAEGLFANAFLDWTHSLAASQEGTQATYAPLTDGSRGRLRERVIFAPAWHLAEVLPNLPNPPSPFLRQLGPKLVLDIWGGRYTDIARTLSTLKEYGIDECLALIHVWQRSGYDNALPTHLPALADLGGDEGMEELVGTARRLGYLIALHENYVDYYPNYDHFDERDIALAPDGQRVTAWYNPGTKIQSFAVKPNAILTLARTQSPEIHRRYGTNACYLDVHSAVPPWFHVDARAGEPGAGTFRRVWEVHRQLWQYERDTHGGPVLGEGNNHWYWSGYLDGVEAQFGAGWPANQGLSAPLMVDFDLLRLHPLQVNHGMGYYERWWARPDWGVLPPMVVLDQYRMQEAVYGHAGFLGGATYLVLPLAWLEHHLLSPVAARHAAAKPAEIRYQVGGRWVDGTEAARSGEWRRVRVRYSNGLTVTANDSPRPLQEGSWLLPRFGWVARGAGVTAYTALRNGVVADYAETEDSVFANARNAAHWNISGVRRLRPSVAEFRQTGPRAFRVSYAWKVGETPDRDYQVFVHFSGAGQDPGDERIRFQQDHAPPRPSTQWRPGETVTDGPYDVRVPDDLPEGDYEWSIGLFSPGGSRVPLEGVEDGRGRIRLGVLQVRAGGAEVTFRPERRTGDERLTRFRRNLNQSGKVVDFGPVRTNGSVLVRREGGDWVLRALPRDRAFRLVLSGKRFGTPVEVRCVGGTRPTVRPVRRRAGDWSLELNGAREYRWPAVGRPRR